MEENEDEAFQLVSTLKSQIIVDDALSDDYEEILRELFTLINENKTLLRHLEKSNFMNETLLLTLRFDKSYDLGLQFITEMIEMGAKIPVYFYSKNFVHFITEKLYEQMDDCSTNIEFSTALIKRERTFISSFEECGYFVLVNSLISEKTCKLYSQIFAGYECISKSDGDLLENSVNKNQRNKVSINEDVMFEIQRKNFDSEIVFRESGLIKFKPRKTSFKQGGGLLDRLFRALYDTNFYSLLECCLPSFVDVLSYKSVKCDWLLDDSSFMDLVFSGNLSALRVLRNIILDCKNNGIAKLEAINFLSMIVKLLEDKSRNVVFETTMCICAFLNRAQCENYKIFTEKRIRCIFSLLEFCCVDCSCNFKFCSEIKHSDSFETTIDESKFSIENDGQGFNTNENNITQGFSFDLTVVSPSKQENMTSKTFSDTLFPTDLTQMPTCTQVNLKCLENCETMKILDLLFKIFNNHKKEFFFKISYMIVLKTINDCLYHHNCFNKNVFNSFFSDFVEFLISRENNFSRVIFPFGVKKESKKDDNNDNNNDDMNFDDQNIGFEDTGFLSD
ncbi:hypothetical protein NGRA_1251 [Nosema granulosis]|uniref:Uncharacterized protein n=1 Tax=Nosema granulosis TaxID=83296 RepID=A0A9P6GYT9_9MICR|nr:hypothetical protein NGRA_1251 [Nosema granulosis]